MKHAIRPSLYHENNESDLIEVGQAQCEAQYIAQYKARGEAQFEAQMGDGKPRVAQTVTQAGDGKPRVAQAEAQAGGGKPRETRTEADRKLPNSAASPSQSLPKTSASSPNQPVPRTSQIVSDESLNRVRKEIAQGKTLSESVINASQDTVGAQSLIDIRRHARQGLVGAGLEIQPLLDDPKVTDVLINGAAGVWVDRGEGIEQVIVNPHDFQIPQVRQLAVRLAAACGQRIDEACPIADGTLPDGTRLNAVLPPLAVNGAIISLRTRRRQAFTIADLETRKMFPPKFRELLNLLIEKRANVFVSGSTGAGKTTILSAIIAEVSVKERIICLEESVELAPRHPHVVHLTVRRANVQNVGMVEISDLVRTAMRMRPDRLVLGECRGAEVRDVLTAINTGHEGGWATIHANSALDVPVRLVALGAIANMPEATVAAQAASAIDAVIHVTRQQGKRKVAQVAVLERESGTIQAELAIELIDGKLLPGKGWAKLAGRLGVASSWA